MIQFEYVEYKNFLAVGDLPVKIFLNRSPNTLISGKNGEGKSTVGDAITYALFGRSYRGVKKANLVNSINKKGCYAEVGFIKGKDRYTVRRQIKPGGLFITKNGDSLDEEAALRDQQGYLETQILGFNFNSFCQTCIIGATNYIPFMAMGAGQRRVLIEDLFGINVFSTMNSVLKSKVSQWKSEIEILKVRMQEQEAKIKMQMEFVDTLKEKSADKVEAKKMQLSRLKENAKELLDRRDSIYRSAIKIGIIYNDSVSQDYSDQLEGILNSIEAAKNKLNEYKSFLDSSSEEFSKINYTIREMDKKLLSLKDLTGAQCPVCIQEVGKEHAESCTKSLESEKEKLEKPLSNSEERKSFYSEEVEKVTSHIEELNSYKASFQNCNESIKNLAKQGRDISNEIKNLSSTETTDSSVSDERVKLEAFKQTYRDLVHKKRELMGMEEPYRLALKMLKDDGIKSLIVKQYLPILNQRVNHYLSAMNFNVRFNLDEKFNESLSSRNMTEFAYGNFSAGERQRIDLAILFSWRDVAGMKNSVSTNLLLLDEIGDSSLDERGIDDLLAILESLKKTNVFIISHRGTFEDKVRSHITFEKVNGFSKIV